MRKIFLIPLILLFALPTIAQQTGKQSVINLLKQMDKAVAGKDSVTLKKILADDFVGSIPNGQSFNKKNYITFYCNPQSKVRELKEEPATNWNVRLFGNTAVVNRTVTSLVKTTSNKPAEVHLQRLEVCVKIKDKWLITAQQGTEVLKK
jgi:hypothetical protein